MLTLTYTTAGLAAISNANHSSIDLEITHIAVGSGHGTFDPAMTSLVDQKEIVAFPAGIKISDTQNEITAILPPNPGNVADDYWGSEIALIGEGVLIAVAIEEDTENSYFYREVSQETEIRVSVIWEDIPKDQITVQYDPLFPLYMQQVEDNYVKFSEAQNLNETQQLQVQANIGAHHPGKLIATFADSFTNEERALACNGQAVSRTTYADLYARIGDTYGAGNGSTTFNVPNIPNGYALLAANGGIVGGITTGENKYHSHSGSTATAGNHAHLYHTPLRVGDIDRGSQSSNWSIDSGGDYATTPAGDHAHGLNINNNGNHSHSLNINAQGGSINAAAGMHLLIGITY